MNVIEFDKETYNITNIDESVFWSFDYFLAQLISQAAAHMAGWPKYGFFSPPDIMKEEEELWRENMEFLQKTFAQYADEEEPERFVQTDAFKEAFDILRETFVGLWT